MRKCSLKSCRSEIPPVKKCETRFQELGFCDAECCHKKAVENTKLWHKRRESKEKKENNKAKREYKNNDMAHQRELTRKSFNPMIRLLDRGKSCPTCGEPLIDGSYDAGHVRTVAACPQIRYDARNCFGQCRACNGSGTIRRKVKKTQEVVSELYKEWVLNEYGKEYYDWLYGPHDSPHLTYDDHVAMRKEFNAETRRLEKGLPPSKDWRAIPKLEEM